MTVLFLALPASASAFVYWVNDSTNTIGRANLDGSSAAQGFIVGAAHPLGLAIDGQHLYWANYESNTIGRANLDGIGVNQSFISGASGPIGVAVDGQHVYWSNYIGGGGTTIGRANLDGSGVNQSFISGASGPSGLTVDSQHIYWSNSGTNSIGRANLDGGSPNTAFISGSAIHLTVDSQHIYWSTGGGNTIGRANLDGSSVNQSFIAGTNISQGVAVDSQHIYWSNGGIGNGTTIGRANLDGSSVNQSFISGASAPIGIVVDSLPHASTTNVACEPATVTLPAKTTCTATVTDVGPFLAAPGAGAPGGTMAFASSGAGAFSPVSTCSLIAASAGQSACQLTYTASAPGSQAISAVYSGEFTHGQSNGATALRIKPSNSFTIAKPKLNARKGTAILTVAVPGPGKLVLEGKGITKRTRKSRRPGTVKLFVKPAKVAKRKLRETGLAKVKVAVTFTPNGGDPKTLSANLTLKLKRGGG